MKWVRVVFEVFFVLKDSQKDNHVYFLWGYRKMSYPNDAHA